MWKYVKVNYIHNLAEMKYQKPAEISKYNSLAKDRWCNCGYLFHRYSLLTYSTIYVPHGHSTDGITDMHPHY